MGFFSNLFKKKDNGSAPQKAKPSKTSDLITVYLQQKLSSGKVFNAKDYFAKDLIAENAESKFENALRSVLGASQVEPCGNATNIDWDDNNKCADISMMIFDYNNDGINVFLYVDMNESATDSIELWVGAVDAPSASINLDYSLNATNSNGIYENAAQKVKEYLQAKGLL